MNFKFYRVEYFLCSTFFSTFFPEPCRQKYLFVKVHCLSFVQSRQLTRQNRGRTMADPLASKIISPAACTQQGDLCDSRAAGQSIKCSKHAEADNDGLCGGTKSREVPHNHSINSTLHVWCTCSCARGKRERSLTLPQNLFFVQDHCDCTSSFCCFSMDQVGFRCLCTASRTSTKSNR